MLFKTHVLLAFIFNRNIMCDNYSSLIRVRSRKTPSIVIGYRVVDVLFSVARAQRELVIGDRQSGKSTIWLCAQVVQSSTNSCLVRRRKIVAVVAPVGGRISTTTRMLRILNRAGSKFDVCILLAAITDPIGAQFMSSLAATAVLEALRNRGYHHHQAAYDDLSKHAVAYRQMCLFLRKPAGREAYPSDVFYLHARLLERSCFLGKVGSTGSLMSLPAIETLNNDLAAYIATNVISITDGQLYLDLTLFGTGQCPAVSTDKSVSRIGAKSLDPLSRATAFRLYAVSGQVRQERDSALKSGCYVSRLSVFARLSGYLVQRNGMNKHVSQLGLLAISVSSCSQLSVKLLGMLTLAATSVSVSTIADGCSVRVLSYDFQVSDCSDITTVDSRWILSVASCARALLSRCVLVSLALTTLSTTQPLSLTTLLLAISANCTIPSSLSTDRKLSSSSSSNTKKHLVVTVQLKDSLYNKVTITS